jgi:queuine tRNA-ribosyltransferase
MEFVPFINSQEGLSLTPLQWQDCGVKTFAYDAALLLQRPGLNSQFNIKHDAICQGFVILDTRNVVCKKYTDISFRMPDGVLQVIDVNQFSQWIDSLKADLVIWSDALPDGVLKTPKISAEEINKHYHLSNQPAEWGFKGIVIAPDQQHYSILDSQFEQDFRLLSENCDCQTCKAGFTRSYLHHLLQHTPLLAQRFLVIHNISQAVIQPLLF